MPAGGSDTDVRSRAEFLTQSLDSLVVFRTAEPARVDPGASTPVAFGIVGLAAGAFVMLSLSFVRPRIMRARDAQRVVALPAVDFRPPDGGQEALLMIRGLLDGRANVLIVVCPVDSAAEAAALQFAEWAGQGRGAATAVNDVLVSSSGSSVSNRRTRPGPGEQRVMLVGPPEQAVLGRVPGPAESVAVLLVVAPGARRQTVVDAIALLADWRAAKVVVVSG